MRDVESGSTILISIAATGESAGNGASSAPIISTDGRRIIFQSSASNLVPNDTNGVPDIFVRDLVSGTTTLLSSEAEGMGGSESPATSTDGQVVAFIKRTTNQVPEGIPVSEVYVRDQSSGLTRWASQAVPGFLPAFTNEFFSFNPNLSADGGVLAFLVRYRTPFTPFSNPATNDALLFRYNLASGSTTLVASNVPHHCYPALNATGDLLAYVKDGDVQVWNTHTATAEIVSNCGPASTPILSCRAPVFSGDGEHLPFIGIQEGKVAAYVYDFASQCCRLVSVTGAGVTGEVVPSAIPAIRTDGHRVAFESVDPTLVSEDLNQASDIFLRDMDDATTRLISVRAPSLPARSGVGLQQVWKRGVSANGKVIAITSLDDDLSEGLTNAWQSVIVRDQVAMTNLSVSKLTAGLISTSLESNQACYPVLSANGRHVAYIQVPIQSRASNIFCLDLQTRITRRIKSFPVNYSNDERVKGPTLALSPDGRFLAFNDGGRYRSNIQLRDQMADIVTNRWADFILGTPYPTGGDSFVVSFSPDGRWLAFISNGDLITTNSLPTSRPLQLYLYNLWDGRNRLASYEPNGKGLSTEVTNVVFSSNSRYAFFHSRGATSILYRHDLQTTISNRVVCNNCWNPAPDASGTLIAYETGYSPRGTNDVFVIDLATGQSRLVSVNYSGTGGGNRRSGSPLMSYDGRYVVFVSTASDLVPNDNNKAPDIFVRDLWNETTFIVGVNGSDTPLGTSGASSPVLSADGRTLFFHSFVADSVSGDFDQSRDVFALKLSGPDADSDGMDDDGEMAYFSTLARDGSGDYDGDGQTDLQEFRAGTNPANNESILRVLTVTSTSGGSKTLLWVAAPSRRYQAQFKDDIEDSNWTDLAGVVTAAGTTGSFVDDTAVGGSRRFYRVVLVP